MAETDEVERKAQPDEEALNVEVASDGGNKVALDIDDAPFLQEDEPEEPEESSEETDAEDTEGEAPPEAGKKSKKKLILIGSAVLLLLIGAGVGWWFFLRTPPPPPPPPIEPEVVKVPSPIQQGADPAEFVVTFAPFWIELPDGKDGVVFLVCKFAAITRDERLALESQNKMPTLRDAVYYYLKNKTYDFLINADNVNTIKTDLSSVLSGYLSGGKIEDVLFESYLGK